MANKLDNVGQENHDRRDEIAWRIGRWSLIAGLIALPLVAMQFTDEVQWTLFDFVFIGLLLGGAGLTFEVVVWKVRNSGRRLLIGTGIVAAVLIVWVEAAVGIFH